MNESIDDLTVEREEDGHLVVKQIDKKVLSKGAWTTIIFRYQLWQPQTDDYSSDKYVIERYQKTGGEYKRRSKFNISSADQARKIVEILNLWLTDEGDSA